ncbi:MAG: hypothetical protein R3E67_08745 [Pseudomonadales bacterium]
MDCVDFGWCVAWIFSNDAAHTAAPIVGGFIGLMRLVFLYPVFANKYWNYHWMPYRYFALMCGSLLLLPTKIIALHRRYSR